MFGKWFLCCNNTSWWQQPGHTLLWDGVPFFNQHLLQVSQHGCVSYSGWSHKRSMALMSGLVAGPLHPLDSQILGVVSDVLCGGKRCHLGGQSLDCEDMGLPLVVEFYLDISLHWDFPPVMTSLFFLMREMPPHTITLSPPKDTLSVQQSPKCSPCLLHTLTLHFKYCMQSLEHLIVSTWGYTQSSKEEPIALEKKKNLS